VAFFLPSSETGQINFALSFVEICHEFINEGYSTRPHVTWSGESLFELAGAVYDSRIPVRKLQCQGSTNKV